MGDGTMGKGHPTLVASLSFLPSCSLLNFPPRAALPCLFGIPGRQLAAALITAPKWQLDLLFVCIVRAARFTVLCSFACRHRCSVQSSLAAPCAMQGGERGAITTKFKGAFPGKVRPLGFSCKGSSWAPLLRSIHQPRRRWRAQTAITGALAQTPRAGLLFTFIIIHIVKVGII